MPDLEARFRIVRELPPPDLWPDIESREPRPRSEPPWRRLGVAALAVTVAAGGLVVAIRAFTGPERRRELPAADPRVTATIPVGPFPRAIAAGEGGVWVVVPGHDTDGGYEGTVERIDPSTNQVVASIPVDTGDAVTAGAGSVWVTGVTNTVGPNGQTSDFNGVVLRIDPDTNRVVDRIPYQGGSPYDIAADATGVWVAQSTGNRSGAILHLDPETGEEVAAIPVADVPYTVTTGEGYVWALLGPRGVVKIDPATDEVVATIDVNPVPYEMAVGEGSVWVQSWLSAFDPGVGTGSEDRLVAVRVDAPTNEFDQPVVFEEGFRPVVVSDGGVWFLGGSPSGQGLMIGRLDPTTKQVDASAALPGIDLAQRNFVAFEPTTGSIWIANYRDSVTRVDLLDSGTVVPCEPAEDDVPAERPFVPPVHGEDGMEVMPVVFSDGTRAELVYPPELDLAGLGVVSRTSGALRGDPSSGRDLLIVHGNADALKAGEAPVACYEGAGGRQAELWKAHDDDVVRFRLFFGLGSWTVSLWDGNAGRLMTDEQRADWARSLVGEETDTGWLVLRGLPPLRLGAEYEGDVQLQIGDLSPRAVLLWPIRCEPYAGEDAARIGGHAVSLDVGQEWFADYCLPEAPMEIHVYDDDGSYGRDVIEGLEIRGVQHAFSPDRYSIVP
jgi:DNA-binding beta-propeller fold protein YncE